METILVKKDQLLAKLQQTRADHRAIFEEALVGFQAKVNEEVERLVLRSHAGFRDDIRISIKAPEDHTRDYDRAIAMVEMSVDDTIALSEHDFAQYVMDDWGWQGQFLRNVYGSNTANSKFSDSYVVE
jgi:hypothetical protein